MRLNCNLLKRFNLIWAVQSCRKKFSAFVVGQITFTTSPHSRSQEGRCATVTNVGWECGGRGPYRWTGDAAADGEVVWS